MILIDPAIQTTFGRTLRRRELTAFLGQGTELAGLRGSVSLLLTGDAQIRRLNRDFRNKDKATDVLSFPAAEMPKGRAAAHAGDLAISVETAARQAEEQQHPLAAELKILILHGLLHLAGYDHEADNGQMARREALLRRRLGLTAGLIERAKNGAQGTGPGASIGKSSPGRRAQAKSGTAAKTAAVKKAVKGKRP
ncbi:rRNA maturation RNase YbeY [Paracidobacterium acidisoli]|uniref:Endoribonuclease YbeY n=1 Tax=Paracidobacterium acidisoli TaxID=2303751 RepID=A0A372IPI7_9BACT|nr:rRNA maturation RNase YbeY [Paracidobacterium acidisoli]MBT9331170.1 rRNA maturation RNase YbeY [Paracidobacterium acidisoli]